MWLCRVRILILICCFHCSLQYDWDFKTNPDNEWNEWKRKASISKRPSKPKPEPVRNSVPSDSDYLQLPEFVIGTQDIDQIPLFKPEMGERPLPDSFQSIFFPTTTMTPSVKPGLVEVLCHLDRLYVRIRREYFRTPKPWRFLTLGNCLVNRGTDDHYYFLNLWRTDCNFTFESSLEKLTVKNIIHYQPTTRILRDLPFDIPVQCNYYRYIHSYRVGIWPKLQSGTLLSSLRMNRPIIVTVTPQDELGNVKTTPYDIRDIIFFEVERLPDGTTPSPNERIYINKCFITSSPVPTSSENAVIDNYGCMVDGLEFEHSHFLSGPSVATQRFSIDGGVLLEMSSTSSGIQKLHMHCEVSVGVHPPNEGSKACNYDQETKMWTELYGDDSVCSCCNSTCFPPLPIRASKSKVISQPWKVNLTHGEDNLLKTTDDKFVYEGQDEEIPPDNWSQWHGDE